MVHVVVGAERHFSISAINTATRGIHQMLHGVMATGFKDVVEANDVAFDVGVGVLDAVADAGLGGEIDYNVEVILFEESIDERFVGDGTFYEPIMEIDSLRIVETFDLTGRARNDGFVKGFQFFQTILFEGYVVVVVEVVEADDGAFGHLFEETFDEVGTDEAG